MSTFKRKPVTYKLAQFFDLPLDTVIDWPQLTLYGNKSLTITNHRGVIEYDQNMARVNTKYGELKISGTGLALTSALKDEVTIEGRITQLELVDWR